jgi:hypothetical protein
MLMWWVILYGLYWPMRLLYWELPKAGWLAYRRWQARRRFAATSPPPQIPPTV